MKNLVIAYILIMAFLSSGMSQSGDNLSMQDPKSTWKWGKGNIINAEYILKPKGNFVICDLYLTYLADIANYSKITDTLEVQHYFTLPENVLVIDSWLWVENQIMKADILDRGEAFNIYEGIVNRRRDPSILYKNSPTSYEFRIFPIPGQKTRRVKLSFMIPLERIQTLDVLKLPVSMINSSRIVPNIKVKIQNGEPSLVSINNSNQWKREYDSLIGNFISTTLTKEDILNLKSVELNFNKSNPINFSYTLNDNNSNEGIYQISLSPNYSLGVSSHPKRNVIIVADHESAYSTLSKSDLKKGINYFIKKVLLPSDSIQILYNDFETKKLFNEFVSIENNNLSTVIENMNVGNFSQMFSSIYEAYRMAATKQNCVVMVFSSSAVFSNASQAQGVKNNLLATFKTLPQTFFNDYTNLKAPGFVQENVYYRGNGLFYKIMATNTKGAFTLPLNTEYKDLNSWIPSLNDISNYFDDLTALPLEMDIRVKSTNGLTYENILFKNTRSGFAQIGKFKGDLPFEIEAVILENNLLFNKNIIINDPLQSPEIDYFKQMHAGYKIQKLEKENLIANRIQVVNLSLENRVLSRFTAFLALEPSLQTPCLNCVDESSTNTSDDNNEKNIVSKVFPNPFSDQLTIEIKGLKVSDKINQIQLFNALGQLQHITYKTEYIDESYVITIDGSHLNPGIYLVSITIGKKVMTYKIVKV